MNTSEIVRYAIVVVAVTTIIWLALRLLNKMRGRNANGGTGGSSNAGTGNNQPAAQPPAQPPAANPPIPAQAPAATPVATAQTQHGGRSGFASFLTILRYVVLVGTIFMTYRNWGRIEGWARSLTETTITDPGEVAGTIEGLSKAFDIPVEEINALSKSEVRIDEKGKTSEPEPPVSKDGKWTRIEESSFKRTFIKHFGISIPDDKWKFYKHPTEVPLQTKTRIPILVKKAWSRPISIVGWQIDYHMREAGAPDLEYMYDMGTPQVQYIRYTVANVNGVLKHQYTKITGAESSPPQEINWQGIRTVRIRLPDDYPLPEGAEGMWHELVKTKVSY